MPKTSLPEAWLNYKPYGSVIDGTRILAFKTPLELRICHKLPPQQRFTPELLMKAVPNLKYIIDLTNTNRYYDKTIFTAAGIQYFKLMITGGEEIPKETKVAEFCRVMSVFASRATNDEVIGVHCTHGINRTGYLICKYLIKVCKWNGHHAIKAFECSREHQIRRLNYIESLLHDSMRPSHYLPSSSTKGIESTVSHLSKLSLPRTNWRDHPPPFADNNVPSFSQSRSFSSKYQNKFNHNYGNNHRTNSKNISHNRHKKRRHDDINSNKNKNNSRSPKNKSNVRKERH